MSGTKIGGMKAAQTNINRYGLSYYFKIGQLGGKAVKKAPGGFGSSVVGKDGLTGIQRASVAGSIGGSKSRRGKANHEG